MTDGKEEADAKKAIKEFAGYLARKNMLSESDKILDEYRMLFNKKHHIVEAHVTVNERLSEKTRLHLREALKKKYKAREVHMMEQVDERIIGGFKVKVHDEVYDNTILNTLKQLQAQLLKS